MKKTITKSIIAKLGGGLLAVLAFMPGKSVAQYCGATDYGNYGYGGDIESIKISNSGGVIANYTGITGNDAVVVLNPGNPIDITMGETLDLEITGSTDGYGYGWATNVGIWIDADQDYKFSCSEYIADGQSGPFTNCTPSTPKKGSIKIPCGKSSGPSRLRFRGNFTYSYYLAYLNCNVGCNQMPSYGNQVDVEINLKTGATPVAAFNIPTGPNYELSNVTFNASNPNTYFNYLWTFQSGTPAATSGAKAKSQWGGPGKYDVKMVVDYCGVKDSITKQVTIVQPTVIPVADFIAKSNLVEQYYDAAFLDLSTNGAWGWDWEFTSPSGVIYTDNVQNPTLFMDEIGKWDVCLSSKNSVGTSNKKCKSKYVECTPPGEFYLGPNKLATNQYGILYDNGGPSLNYSNNRKVTIDYFQILPCGAKEIRLSFKSLKFRDANDKLRIYDGKDESGMLITPSQGINGSNQNTYRNQIFKATSGSMYITFESNNSGNDSGIIAVWESDLLPPQKPKSKWNTQFNPAAIGTTVDFISDVSAQGNVEYEWLLDQNPFTSVAKDFSYIFTTSTTYEVCLAVNTCNGGDTFCNNITIFTPQAPGSLDYVASNVRPKVNDLVKITTSSDYANMFDWSIFPTTFTYENGTSASSKNPELKFLAGGPYTFTLRAWNSDGGKTATEKKLIKNKYVIALDYCIPPVDLLSSDVGINNVNLSYNSTTLLDNQTTSGAAAYTDYSESMKTKLTYGATYDLMVSRKTNSNQVNYKAWIDFNIDGDFDDVGEEILNSGAISGNSASQSFTVPNISASFEGITKMRVGVAYGNFSNTPCGVNVVGEFEDYGIELANDMKIPVITLIGADTVRVEKGTSKTSCYQEVAGKTSGTYYCEDGTEGDITNKVIVTTDLDCLVPGIYTFEFNAQDASGNKALTRTRTVIVVLDKTPPVLTLNGSTPYTVEQCDPFTDPGAIADDFIDKDLTSAIIVSGSVNTSVVGTYTLTYTVSDAQGNTSSLDRIVNVVDTKAPHIRKVGVNITNNAVVDIQIGSVFVDDIYSEDVCNGIINIVKTPGFNGPVNTGVRATYPVTYTSMDPSGNKAVEDGFVINYKVDDYIAPSIMLNTDDTIIHDVNNPYASRPVTVLDNYYPLNKLSLTKYGTVDAYTLGTYTETYSATDESGNTATKVRTIKVVDRIAPSILAPAVSVCVGTPFWAMSGIKVQDNYYSPTVLMPLVKVLSHNVNIWEAGVYNINYELSDPSGNAAQWVSRTIYVEYPPNCQNTFTGVEKIKLADAVSIFPNPTAGEITVGYTLTNGAPLNIEVFNAVGVKVAELKNLKGGFGTQRVDLGAFGSGTYLVRLTNNGESATKQIVVAH